MQIDLEAPRGTRMPMPSARGPLSAHLIAVLSGLEANPGFAAAAQALVDGNRDHRWIVFDEDAQLSLTILYELHLQGLSEVSDRWEWDLDLLAGRATLEAVFEAALREIGAVPAEDGPEAVVPRLWEMTAPSAGPGMSTFMAREADVEQFREVLIHRSLNQLREADVHTLGIPRLAGAPKGALVEVQADEYGGGRLERMHSTLFATTMRELGLSSQYAHYLDLVPSVTLASLNALSLFGLHRRLLGALVGHLCAVETTSSAPSKDYSAGLRRLGFGRAATLFYDEHVEADSVHEQIVVRDLAGGLAQQRPELAADIIFGAAACLALDDLLGAHITGCWSRGESSLRAPAV
ncbi:iron-containing redox enzyme family protein [Tomitella biformata]|uniref:iron-containing redox enzyme family protein n=1 Tax=Tomitella biformata TaxID=630403 RepID=UPI0004637330|nr:iron-containing redox enzyme family protein [Tomitella biformata]